jgi:dolichol-phosphate mannosyltransferase
MKNQGVSIIVPTYREIENIPKLVDEIGQLKKNIADLELIVVDDNSQDGTEELIKKNQKRNEWVRLIVRKNQRGLSTAVIEGFNQARYPILICMDADLSHPVDKIPVMLDEIVKPGVDMVIGSRNIMGGKVYDKWSFFRWINAWTAKSLACFFTSVKDPMSGFFCIKKSTLKKAAPLNPIGYKIGLELLVKCSCKNVKEIPIHFSKRYKGKSKLNRKEIFNYLRHLYRLMLFKMSV